MFVNNNIDVPRSTWPLVANIILVVSYTYIWVHESHLRARTYLKHSQYFQMVGGGGWSVKNKTKAILVQFIELKYTRKYAEMLLREYTQNFVYWYNSLSQIHTLIF